MLLGVPVKSILGSEDFNDIDGSGTYTLGNNINTYPNSPAITTYGMLIVFRGYSTYCVQIAVGISAMAFRLRGNSWNSWVFIKQ